MSRKAKYTIGGKDFATKAEIIEYAKNIKDAHEAYDVITDEAEKAFLLDLLNYHYDAATKIGVGVKDFFVAYNEKVTGTEWRFHRNDDTEANFAPKKCVGEFDPVAHVMEACRTAIFDQINAFREAAFAGGKTPECPVYKIPLTKLGCHVDHQYPDTFAALVRRWMATNKYQVEDVKLGGKGATDANKTLSDPDQAKLWQDYHRSNARLRVVSPKANTSDLKKGIPRTVK